MSEHDEPQRWPDDDLEARGLEEWDDDDLVRALRAPGSPGELGHEQEYVAAFRQASGPVVAPVPLVRRAARRLGTGGTAVVVAVALGGGVAAAYTGNLPDPVQEIAHSVIGAPAPEPDLAPAAGPLTTASPSPATTSPSASASPAPSASPSAQPTASPGDQPSAAPSPTRGAGASPGQGASATAAPTDQPGTSPAPPPPPRATAARITAAAHLAAYGQTVALEGRLSTSTDAPAAGIRVALQVARGDGWQIVTTTVTDAAGQASASSLPVTGLAKYRWRAAGVHSRVWQLKARATLSSTADVGDPQTTITATAVGAKAGDQALLYTVVRGQATVVGRGQIAADGTVSFTFRTPAARRVFVVRLPATPDHTAARSRVVVSS